MAGEQGNAETYTLLLEVGGNLANGFDGWLQTEIIKWLRIHAQQPPISYNVIQIDVVI